MIQLRVYNNNNQYWLDLYPESPIKITLSVEDITDTEATSTFSRLFRVPNTKNNYEFFRTAFMVDGIDYDVTVKKPAEILVDGQPFKSGHIRLQKIYNNEDLSRVDYEIVFLGETRDFASALGDKSMCQIDLDLTHTLDYNNVITSWQAYPEGGLTAGLFNGDVLYPLINHGNTYDDDLPLQAQIKTFTGHHPFSFTQNSHPIFADRFKPMIRAKALIDAIFAQTEYSYDSTFLNSNKFKKIYISAFGNDASPYAATDQSANLFDGFSSSPLSDSAGVYIVPIDTENSDPGNNFNTATYSYTCPTTGSYTFSASALVNVISFSGTTAFATAELWVNGSLAFTGSSSQFAVFLNATQNLTAGDVVTFRVAFSAATDIGLIEEGATFRVTAAPGLFNPIANLDCEYKQIDFIKDILTLFRLVIAPVKDDPYKFRIEPWNEYIAKGQIFDWTAKLDRNKDVQLEPLFFTQTDRIEFKFTEDEDYLNKTTQDNFKEVYGQLNFDSGSELLKNTRKIEVGMAPTPITQIEGDPNTSSWVIPNVFVNNVLRFQSAQNLKYTPLRAKTRILFYTGIKPTSEDWYFSDGVTTHKLDEYPLVHYQESWPPQANDLNLNWARWFAYYSTNGSLVGYDPYAGQSLYETYWANYIASLYNKYSRRLTATFILDNLDLTDLTFDDIIFLDGAYWRPEKIIDAPIGEKAPVKVQLIRLNNFKPSDIVPPEQFYYYEIAITDCTLSDATLHVMQSPVELTIGVTVAVVGSDQCWNVIGEASTSIYEYVWVETFVDCETCLTEIEPKYIYAVNKWTVDCQSILEDSLIVESNVVLNVGDTVQLTINDGCWYVAEISQLTTQDSVFSIQDCAACQGELWYYVVQECLTGEQVQAVTNEFDLFGKAVTLLGREGCWFPTDRIAPPVPGAIPALQIYPDCETCGQ